MTNRITKHDLWPIFDQDTLEIEGYSIRGGGLDFRVVIPAEEISELAYRIKASQQGRGLYHKMPINDGLEIHR